MNAWANFRRVLYQNKYTINKQFRLSINFTSFDEVFRDKRCMQFLERRHFLPNREHVAEQYPNVVAAGDECEHENVDDDDRLHENEDNGRLHS